MSQGGTPLYLAAERGHTATAEALIAKGADVNAMDVSGRGREPWREWGGELLVKTTCASKRCGAAE